MLRLKALLRKKLTGVTFAEFAAEKRDVRDHVTIQDYTRGKLVEACVGASADGDTKDGASHEGP